jgi:hypothetical protein
MQLAARIELAQQRDATEFGKYMESHNCPVLQAGTAVLHGDLAFAGRAICVCRPGDSSCFWIPSAAVQKPRQSVPPAVF